MKKIRVCVVGYGNVGREAVECIRQAPDMEPALSLIHISWKV